MLKSKTYRRTFFSVEVLREATEAFGRLLSPIDGSLDYEFQTLEVHISDEWWDYDTFGEFLSDYRKATYALLEVIGPAHLYKHKLGVQFVLTPDSGVPFSKVSVRAPSRDLIESLFEVFETRLADSVLPKTAVDDGNTDTAPTIFIGHGRSPLWKDLKDHLHDKHKFPVEAYETGARAGHAIRDILQDMMKASSFALLVMTGEDKLEDGTYRARQNVIHEAGLFQGKLGFSRAIILLEEGVDEFSNLAGIEQIRFSKGNIKETFGDVLATLRREFDAAS